MRMEYTVICSNFNIRNNIVRTCGMFMCRLFFVAVVLRECFAVRFVYLGVPGSTLIGEPVWLDCGYDLEDDELYSVKWYKDNYEFYRYLPGDRPPSQMLNLKGVYLDIKKSNATHVFLKTIDLETEGSFACEVSTDAPSFRTVRAEKDLRVYVMPNSDPKITGVSSYHPIGKELNATCYYGPSKPIAQLTWYINGEKATSSYVTEHVLYDSDQDVGSVESQLKFVVYANHLEQGYLSLDCKSSVSQVYSTSSEELVVGDSSSATEFQRLTQVAPGQEGPSITGGMSKYDIGDMVNVNCTSARSRKAAELAWYINDRKITGELITQHQSLLYADGYVSTRLGLKFQVNPEHFRREEMRLKCTATLSNVIELTATENIFGDHRESSGHLQASVSKAADFTSGHIQSRFVTFIALCDILLLFCR